MIPNDKMTNQRFTAYSRMARQRIGLLIFRNSAPLYTLSVPLRRRERVDSFIAAAAASSSQELAAAVSFVADRRCIIDIGEDSATDRHVRADSSCTSARSS